MAWAKLATKTLTSAGTNVTTDTFTASKFMTVLFNSIDPSNSDEPYRTRLNSDATSNYYSRRSSLNGAADATDVADHISLGIGTAVPSFCIEYWVNISTEEKLCIMFYVEQNTATASYIPNRRECVGKWANTTTQITTYQKSFATRTFATDTNATVLGSDSTAVGGIQNGLEFHETDTNKDYVYNSSNSTWYQIA